MKAIHFLAPATFAISAALNPAIAAEPASAVATSAKGCRTADSRKAVLVRTEIVSSTRVRRLLGCDNDGNLLSYYVTMVTIRKMFSDGTSRCDTRTIGA